MSYLAKSLHNSTDSLASIRRVRLAGCEDVCCCVLTGWCRRQEDGSWKSFCAEDGRRGTA